MGQGPEHPWLPAARGVARPPGSEIARSPPSATPQHACRGRAYRRPAWRVQGLERGEHVPGTSAPAPQPRTVLRLPVAVLGAERVAGPGSERGRTPLAQASRRPVSAVQTATVADRASTAAPQAGDAGSARVGDAWTERSAHHPTAGAFQSFARRPAGGAGMRRRTRSRAAHVPCNSHPQPDHPKPDLHPALDPGRLPRHLGVGTSGSRSSQSGLAGCSA